ncbi:MAG: NAD(P)-dependent oxidoreductase [Caldilineales bacterium]|nr:NAD(P)-dependent oxidoreductase [Caldilineales bacterium]MCW5857370.1 NAD(P)-dependent oxidoreductase [Caldilineales bacterium]
MNTRTAFIGLGIMGQGMARNLLRAGFPLTAWNRTAAKTQALAAEGALAATTPAQAAATAEIIIICVSDTPDVEGVLFGPDGIAEGASAGSLVIDCSTISPTATRQMAAKLAAKGIHHLDAPVSGGSEGAAKGTLSIMVGGDAEDFARALPVLQAIGKQITHVGGHGAGQTVKLMNQILVVGHALALSEALLFGQANDIDLDVALEAVKAGAAGSWMLSFRGPQVLARDWRPGFTIDLQQKDLRLVLEAADQAGVPLPATSLIFQFYRTLQAQGLGGEGNHALIKALEHLAGLEVRGSRAD